MKKYIHATRAKTQYAKVVKLNWLKDMKIIKKMVVIFMHAIHKHVINVFGLIWVDHNIILLPFDIWLKQHP